MTCKVAMDLNLDCRCPAMMPGGSVNTCTHPESRGKKKKKDTYVSPLTREDLERESEMRRRAQR